MSSQSSLLVELDSVPICFSAVRVTRCKSYFIKGVPGAGCAWLVPMRHRHEAEYLSLVSDNLEKLRWRIILNHGDIKRYGWRYSDLFWSKPAWTLPLRIKVGVKKCKLRRENILHLIMHYISTIRSLSFSSIIPIAIIPNSNPWDLRSDLRWTIRDWNSPSGWIISYHFGHSCICVLDLHIRSTQRPPRLSIVPFVLTPIHPACQSFLDLLFSRPEHQIPFSAPTDSYHTRSVLDMSALQAQLLATKLWVLTYSGKSSRSISSLSSTSAILLCGMMCRSKKKVLRLRGLYYHMPWQLPKEFRIARIAEVAYFNRLYAGDSVPTQCGNL